VSTRFMFTCYVHVFCSFRVMSLKINSVKNKRCVFEGGLHKCSTVTTLKPNDEDTDGSPNVGSPTI